SQRQVLQRRDVNRRTAAVAGTGEELADTAAVGNPQGHARGDGVLNAEVPVLVIGRFAAELRVAVGGVLNARRIGGDETGPVAGIDKGRRLRNGRHAVIPVIGGRVGAGAVRAVGGVETQLAESLARVIAAADAAYVHIHDRIARAHHSFVVDAVRCSDARSEI